MPSPALIEANDYVLIHGNGLRPSQVEAAIKAVCAMPAWQANPKPIVIWRALARGAQPGGGVAERLLVGLLRPGL